MRGKVLYFTCVTLREKLGVLRGKKGKTGKERVRACSPPSYGWEIRMGDLPTWNFHYNELGPFERNTGPYSKQRSHGIRYNLLLGKIVCCNSRYKRE